MNEINNFRRLLLRVLFAITIIAAGSLGISMLLSGSSFPMNWMLSTSLGTGLYASVLLAFSVCSIMGLFYPERFISILVLQLLYKLIWLIGVVLPNSTDPTESNGVSLIISIWIFFIIFDLFVIPFRYLFQKGK